MIDERRESEALQPGPLRLRDAVRRALLALRHFTEVTRPALSRPWPPGPPGLELGRVAAVEGVLGCRLPDEVLACLANEDNDLGGFGFALARIADHTREAHGRGCPAELVAVGRHPGGNAFYCITRAGPRDRHVRLFVRDDFDGGLAQCDLAGWLAGRVAARRAVLARERPGLADWAPDPAEVAAFAPALVAGPGGSPGPGDDPPG